MDPKVTVIIPTYNRAQEVIRAAKSALEQRLLPHQIIIVDDGSTDDTALLVQALPSPVHYVAKPNGGVSSARNLGLRLATGDHVALLDSDDYWSPDWLDAAVRAIASTDGGGAACCTRLRRVQQDGREIGIGRNLGPVGSRTLAIPDLLQGGIMGSNVVFRRDLLATVGDFDTELRTGEDIDFSLRLAAATTIATVPEPLVSVTSTPGSLSKNVNTGNRLRVYTQFEQKCPDVAKRYARALLDARVVATLSYARDLMWDRQLSAAWDRLRESWKYRPTIEAAVLAAKLSLLVVLGRQRRDS